MPAVRAPALVAHRRRAAAGAAIVIAAALAVALGASVLSDAPHRPARAPSAGPGVALLGGAPLQQARCAQWAAGTPAERARMLAVLGAVVGGPTEHGTVGSTLTASEATRLFDAECASPIARGFLLYELYIRAAAFRNVVPR